MQQWEPRVGVQAVFLTSPGLSLPIWVAQWGHVHLSHWAAGAASSSPFCLGLTCNADPRRTNTGSD